MIFKNIVILGSLLLSTVVYASELQEKVSLVIKTMNHCYEAENKIGVELAKCILAKFDKVKNPNGYKVNIEDSNPSKVIASDIKIVIHNKLGEVVVCKGVAKNKIVIKQCHKKQIKALTPNEQLSITPPE